MRGASTENIQEQPEKNGVTNSVFESPLAVDYLLIVSEHCPRSNAKDLGWYSMPIISYCSGLEGDKPVGWDISGWSDQFGSGLVLLPVHNALPNK